MTGAEFWAAVGIFALGAVAGWCYRGWWEWRSMSAQEKVLWAKRRFPR